MTDPQPHGEDSMGENTNVPGQGQGEVVPSPQAAAGAAAHVQRVARRPLTPAQAGGRYAYLVDCAREGTKTLPISLFDGVANRVRMAHLRDGGTHRGAILPQNRNAYDKAMTERSARRAELARSVFVKKVRRTSTSFGGMVKASSHGSRPRWLTIAPLAAEATTIAAPDWFGAGLVNQANSAVGGFLGDLAANSADLLVSSVWSWSGLAVLAAGAAGVAGWRGLGEHRDRQDAAAELAAQGIDVAEITADGDSGAELTRAFREAGLIKSASGAVPGQRITLEGPVAMDPSGESWTAQLVLPGSVTTAKVKGRLSELSSALDRDASQVSITSGSTEGRCTLRVWMGDALPFTGPPVPSPLAGAAVHDLRRGVPIGRDIDGREVVLDLAKGRHGLVVASSGNGKTELLKTIAAAVVLDPAARLTILDGKPDGAFTQLQDVCVHFKTTAAEDYAQQGAEVLASVAAEMDANLAAAERGEEVAEHVVIIDEFQEWTGNANGAGQKVGSAMFRMRESLERLARRGRAGKIRLILASQQYDGRTLDHGVLTNIGWRSVGYAPKKMSLAALGPLAERYGLDTSTAFVDEVQAGAAIIAGGGIHPYRSQRGYLLSDEDLERVAAQARRLRARDAQPVPGAEPAPALAAVPSPSAGEDGDQAESELPPLLEAVLAYVDGCALDGDDREQIPTSELHDECAPEMSVTRFGAELAELGVPKIPGRTPARAVADIRVAAGVSRPPRQIDAA